MDFTGFTMQYLTDRVVIDDSGCWLWQRAIDNLGYASLHRSRGGVSRTYRGHQLAYWLTRGEHAPSGWHIDHLCRVRHCVRPDHLEAVPPGVNVMRGMAPVAVMARIGYCKRGHKFEGENIYTSPQGRRFCRPCARLREQRRAPRDYSTRRRGDLDPANVPLR